MNAIGLLVGEHEVMAHLLRELEGNFSADEVGKRYALRRFASLFDSHNVIEEEILYAAFHKAGGAPRDEMLYYEALAEHRALSEMMLPDLMRTPLVSPAFPGRLKALREQFEHHCAEEEEEIFPRVREMFDDKQLEDMGARLALRRKEIGLIG